MEYFYSNNTSKAIAVSEFEQAFQKARCQALYHKILNRSCCLLPFETVKKKFHLAARLERGLQEICLDKIIGSVGKPEFFTRTLLPMYCSLEERWSSVYGLMLGQNGYQPIEVYKVEDVYYILDGHHRASVARVLGNKKIEAYVSEWIILASGPV